MITFTVLLGASLVLAPADGEEAVTIASAALGAGNARLALQTLEPFGGENGFASLDTGVRGHALTVYGQAAAAIDDHETAIAALLQALALPPGDLDVITIESAAMGLARSALKTKDGETARKALEHLSSESRSRQPAKMLLAMSSFFEGRTKDAEVAFESCAKEQASPEAEYFLGVILFDRGDRVEALQRFESATRLDPSDYYAWIYRTRTLLELNRAQQAMEVLASLSGSFATAEVDYLSGKALLRLGKPVEAAASFEKALQANPAYAEALFGLGTALRQGGKQEEARESFKRFEALHRIDADRLRDLDRKSQALLRSPGDARLAEELAQTSFASGDFEGAERHAWRAVRADPARRGARLTLARSFARSGQYNAAALQYQRILQSNSSDGDARRELEELVARHAKRKQ